MEKMVTEQTPVQIEKAKEMGFCFGVKQALKIVEKTAPQYSLLATLGAIVHNPQVVANLAKQGVRVAENLEEIGNKVVVIPSHGVGEQTLEEMKRREFHIIDATCPLVRKAQKVAAELAQAGFTVVVFGEANHPEVRGVIGWTRGRGMATLEEQEAEKLTPPFSRLGILSQTTQSPLKFAQFVSRWTEDLLPQLKELRVINTICEATKKRQNAARKLAQRADMMIVIGGKNSANSRRLAELCSSVGVETHHIETAAEIQEAWLTGKKHIGITAGASTPDEVIAEVERRLKEMTQSSG